MEIRKLAGTGNVDAVAISPDSRYVIYARRNGEMVSLRMRQIQSSGDVEVLPAAGVIFHGMTFSPDGNYLYFVRSAKNDIGYRYLYVMPALGGPSQKLIDDVDSAVSFSPDGRQYVFMRGIPTKDEIQVRIANLDGSGDHLLATMEEKRCELSTRRGLVSRRPDHRNSGVSQGEEVSIRAQWNFRCRWKTAGALHDRRRHRAAKVASGW